MRRIGVISAGVAMLGLAAALGGCTATDKATTWADDKSAAGVDRLSVAGDRIGMPWGSPRPTMPEDSVTIARLSGKPVEIVPLQTEGGDVWPVPEAPRSTLANPDAAMRNIPSYRPGEFDKPSAPAGQSQWQPTDPPRAAPLPPGLRSGASSPPPPPIRQPDASANFLAPPGDTSPPPRRADGRVIQTPGGPAVTTGGTDRIQSYTTPGGGTGTAIIDGNTTTLIGPNGQVQSIPTGR